MGADASVQAQESNDGVASIKTGAKAEKRFLFAVACVADPSPYFCTHNAVAHAVLLRFPTDADPHPLSAREPRAAATILEPGRLSRPGSFFLDGHGGGNPRATGAKFRLRTHP